MGRVGKKANQYPHHEEVAIEERPSTQVLSGIWGLCKVKTGKRKQKTKKQTTQKYTNTKPSRKNKN